MIYDKFIYDLYRIQNKKEIINAYMLFFTPISEYNNDKLENQKFQTLNSLS